MAKVKQKVYLVTEQQRDALLNYLLDRPYREVAGGVQLLTNAPTTTLNVEVPEEESPEVDSEQPDTETIEESQLEVSATPEKEFAVLSRG